ncbi:MAG: Smr/MutS family protein [Rikenellaceae bacterium]
MIKLGDRVKFINDVGVGTVIKISGQIVTVDREDGFEVPALITELVVVPKEEEMRVITRIGVSDVKPGRVKRNREEQEAYREQKKHNRSALSRYGRVTLADEYEEDEEDMIDMYAIKENYIRNMANVNTHLTNNYGEKDGDKPFNDTSIFDEDKKNVEVVVSYETKDEKEAKMPKSELVKLKPKREEKPKNEMQVIDLHASELLESEAGMTPADILKYQLECFAKAIDAKLESKTRGKIVFIHGVGSGKLKYELTTTLRAKYKNLHYQDASFREYGYGALMVIF